MILMNEQHFIECVIDWVPLQWNSRNCVSHLENLTARVLQQPKFHESLCQCLKQASSLFFFCEPQNC